jgi:PAS domain S-box-containing protein
MTKKPVSLKRIEDFQSNKLTFERLWESEESLRVLMNSNPEAVFILDAEGNFVAANEKASQRFGKPLEDLINTNVFSYLSPELAVKRKEKVDEVINSGKPIRFEDSRNNRYFDNYLHPILDSKGNVIRIAVWVIDFTDRKLAIDALKASEEKFRELAENIQDIFWIRTDKEVLYVSPAYEIICGKSCETLYKDPDSFLNAVHPEDFERILKSFTSEKYIKTGLFDEEFRILRPDGEVRWIWAKTFPIKTNGELSRTVGIAEDISLRKEYEEQIRKALIKEKELNDLKTRFISMVSHEFRTPLGLILSSAELLQNYGMKWNEEKRNEQFGRIKNAVDGLTAMMNDIITLGEEESSNLQLSPEKINIISFLKDLIEELKLISKEYPLINFSYDKKSKIIVADKKLLCRIFQNLISNAIKFTPAVKNIFISLKSDGEKFYFEVKDEGMGIPEDDITNIFEPFIRSRNSADIKGSGLGLSIVKHSVELLHGEIKVSSKLNKGSVFTVTLPAAFHER